MSETISIPFPRSLYDNIIRFSDGRVDPAWIAQDQVEQWVARSVEDFNECWGDRVQEVAEIYAPDIAQQWRQEDRAERAKQRRAALHWKEVTIPAGSQVRMAYGGIQHYAEVQNGAIVDDGKTYSPSEWASKVADGTSRNAWRDIWIKEPFDKHWVPAQKLRELARGLIERTRSLSLDDVLGGGGGSNDSD